MMMKKLQQLFLLISLLVMLTPANAQLPSTKNSAIKNVVAINADEPAYFTIQVLALKIHSKDAGFFKAFDSAKEYFCADGYYRYVVGKYNSKEEAQAALAQIKSLGERYSKSYVVNTANFTLNAAIKKSAESTQNKENRTNKKIILADKITEPYFAIQILAMKVAPQDPNFFDNIEQAREFACKDGWTRWTVGQYQSKEEASAQLSKTRALSTKYKSAFVVNTSNYQLAASAFSQEQIGERTNKKIVPTDKLPNAAFTIQVLALKFAPQDALFFENIEQAFEVSCTDGFKRYLVGAYNTKEEAASNLANIRKLGPKYKNAFIVATANIQVDKAAFTSDYTNSSPKTVDIDGKTMDRLSVTTERDVKIPAKAEQSVVPESTSMRTNKKIIPVDKATEPFYTVQLLALKEAPKDPNFFDKIENAREFSCTDGYKRYVVGEFKTAEEAAAMVDKIRSLNPKFAGAFVANTESYQIEQNAFQRNYNEPGVKTENKKSTTTAINSDKTKIESATISKPFFTAQLVALKEAPKDPNFFDKIDNVKEIACADGYKRYVAGEFETAEEAAKEVAKIRKLNTRFAKAYVVNTGTFKLEEKTELSNTDKASSPTSTKAIAPDNVVKTPTGTKAIATNNAIETPTGNKVNAANNPVETPTSTKAIATNNNVKTPTGTIANNSTETKLADSNAQTNKTEASNTVKEKPAAEESIDPNKIYSIQVTASRYPFYTSELKEFNEVFEFFMPDKVYRYTVGKYRGNTVKAELKKVLGYGYKEAFIVEWDKYAPYIIE